MLSDSQLIEAAGDLRTQCLKTVPGFLPGPEARGPQVGLYRKLLPAARKGSGRVEVLTSRGSLRALMVAGEVDCPWSGGRVYRVLVDHDRRSSRAAAWLREHLEALFSNPPPDLELTMLAPYRSLLEKVDGQRVHVGCVILVGRPGMAVKGLGTVDCQARLEAEGLSLGSLQTMEEVERVLAWKREYFSRHPEFGWFCASDAFLDAERTEMAGELAKAEHDMFLLFRGGEPVGYFGFCLSNQPGWGLSASMDLILDPSLHGRGLARVAYSVLCQRMAQKGVRSFRGGTSQPGVMTLGRVMRRAPLGWVVNAGPSPFPRGYFGVGLVKGSSERG